ncbi:hypothetical protein [Nostoc sp. FACHB-110]|uniref:hypothetical protein n=1 Tax=Nostoc sp. FACHB-110 TaxID=2692834 RepID=UPI00168688E0|nr:hypothetical protein [Nostoc sp. FACHB-110]MBD2438267.1 hypothetical protein [Nostoc sp. FACHB-110]
MTYKNGKTQKTSRRREDSQRKDESRGLVKYGGHSSIDGHDQIGLAAPHCPGQDFPGQTSKQPGENAPGKILERLEFIENAHLQYVDDHERHLQTRLTQSREQKEVFKKAVLELKQEIYDLVSTDKTEHT